MYAHDGDNVQEISDIDRAEFLALKLLLAELRGIPVAENIGDAE